ncbi:hypothetical protein JQ612_21125 [Bradyrhizobium manausense]|nr:hypothetical protein [Bradyrhizobium manausense]
MKRAEVLVRLGLVGIQRNRPLEVGLRLLEPAEPLQAKAARLIQGSDIWIEPGKYIEAFQRFGISAEIEQRLALLGSLQALSHGLQILRCNRPRGCGRALLVIHKLTRNEDDVRSGQFLVGSWCEAGAGDPLMAFFG